MFNNLPEAIKKQVVYFLEHDDFKAAKKLYDQWRQQNMQQHPA